MKIVILLALVTSACFASEPTAEQKRLMREYHLTVPPICDEPKKKAEPAAIILSEKELAKLESDQYGTFAKPELLGTFEPVVLATFAPPERAELPSIDPCSPKAEIVELPQKRVIETPKVESKRVEVSDETKQLMREYRLSVPPKMLPLDKPAVVVSNAAYVEPKKSNTNAPTEEQLQMMREYGLSVPPTMMEKTAASSQHETVYSSGCKP